MGCVPGYRCGSIFGMAPPRIGIVGEFQPNFAPHSAIAPSVEHARGADGCGLPATLEWVATDDAENMTTQELAGYAGWWIAPGSPYRSMGGALKVIRYAREQDIPLLGTCGGYQHVVLEYARNVLGFSEAAHAEYDPYASDLFISEPSCSLAGHTMTVAVRENTTAAALYKQGTVAEKYYCAHRPRYSMRSSAGGRRPSLVNAGSTSVKAGIRFVGSPSHGSASSWATLRRPPKARKASKSEMLSAR